MAEPTASKGDIIRARIAANRTKRLAMAEALKREARVTGHEITTEYFGGLAFLGTGRIWSPAGRNMRQLYIVAHECGHIFLHSDGVGRTLPTHVQEMEAESYAHQAFREHGMDLPCNLSDWGRAYVASWIAKDRKVGLPIDLRAVEYAKGARSPYEPLRRTPRNWRIHRGLSGSERRSCDELEAEFVRRTHRSMGPHRLKADAQAWLDFLLRHGSFGYLAGIVLSIWVGHSRLAREIGLPRSSDPMITAQATAGLSALLWTSMAAMLRTMRR